MGREFMLDFLSIRYIIGLFFVGGLFLLVGILSEGDSVRRYGISLLGFLLIIVGAWVAINYLIEDLYEDINFYRNDKLKVLIERGLYGEYIYYRAGWTNINGDVSYSDYINSKSELLKRIHERSEEMSAKQIKWFEHMIKNEI